MSRYIDADKAYEIARKYHKDFSQSIGDLTSLREVLEDTPTADVTEVVRCKDCKYLMFSDMYGECSQAHMGIVRPDDFCSYGEREDEVSEEE